MYDADNYANLCVQYDSIYLSMGGYRQNKESVTCNGTGRNYFCDEYKERKSMVFNCDPILEV